MKGTTLMALPLIFATFGTTYAGTLLDASDLRIHARLLLSDAGTAQLVYEQAARRHTTDIFEKRQIMRLGQSVSRTRHTLLESATDDARSAQLAELTGLAAALERELQLGREALSQNEVATLTDRLRSVLGRLRAAELRLR